jgi:hypothetical protein
MSSATFYYIEKEWGVLEMACQAVCALRRTRRLMVIGTITAELRITSAAQNFFDP